MTSNQIVHKKRNHFLDHFFMAFHTHCDLFHCGWQLQNGLNGIMWLASCQRILTWFLDFSWFSWPLEFCTSTLLSYILKNLMLNCGRTTELKSESHTARLTMKGVVFCSRTFWQVIREIAVIMLVKKPTALCPSGKIFIEKSPDKWSLVVPKCKYPKN